MANINTGIIRLCIQFILGYTLKMLGKFSWAIVGWLKKFTILRNYYPIEPSSDLTNIGQLFYLNIERIFTNSIGNGGLGTCCPVVG